MVSLPAGKGVPAVKVAVPVPSRATVVVPPVLKVKVTVPVGMPAPGSTGATTAEMVICWPWTDGFGAEVTVVVVVAGVTVWVSFPVDAAKLASPL